MNTIRLDSSTTAEVAQGRQRFRAAGIARKHGSSAISIRQIFNAAFEAAGLPYTHPHSFRKTPVQLVMSLGLTPEQFKA